MLSDLRSHILSDNDVSQLIKTRMFPLKLPQNTSYPAISYGQVSGVRNYTLCGPAGRAWPRITINAWAKSYAQVRDLADAIRESINGYYGTMNGTEIGSIRLDNELDLYEEEVGAYRVMQDYIISFVED